EGLPLIKYQVYVIKKEFAYHYYYKSYLLSRCLKNYLNIKNRAYLKTQFNYITRPFQTQTYFDLLNFSNPQIKFIYESTIEIPTSTQSIYLESIPTYLTIYSKSLVDLERYVFPTLKSLRTELFVVGINIREYGWLTSLRNIQVIH